ncbi:MAG: amidohydrolase [Alphaproteobacteria bacterium]|nr:MAG: amidohydrolase [Alphaproteobacteria bacterium]
MPDNDAWLAQVTEDIIDPDLPIIDPHHHLWDRNGDTYLLRELHKDTDTGHNIVATVFVECSSMYRVRGPEHLSVVGETEFVNGIAAQSASGEYGPMQACAGIVSTADFCMGSAVDEVLEAHIAAAPDRFRGIRHAAGWDDDPRVKNSHSNPPKDMMLDATFREGYARLAHYGLSFDAWCYHHQIPQLTDLARAHPEVPIIFDHFGGPLGIGPYEGKADEVFAQWKLDVAELAKCENVYAKIGGVNMAVNGFGFHKRDTPATSDDLVAETGGYYRHSIDVFGPDRCMFESNFPVDKVSVSYPVLWNAFKKIAAGFSDDEKRDLFHDTAKRAYRLDL